MKRPEWYQAVVNQITAFYYLQDDWDSYGARAPTSQTIKNAIQLLDRIACEIPMPKVVPTVSGHISFFSYESPFVEVLVTDQKIILYLQGERFEEEITKLLPQEKLHCL